LQVLKRKWREQFIWFAEFVNNERRLDGQELSEDDDKIQNNTIMVCGI